VAPRRLRHRGLGFRTDDPAIAVPSLRWRRCVRPTPRCRSPRTSAGLASPS
jgi:hypothetical protein